MIRINLKHHILTCKVKKNNNGFVNIRFYRKAFSKNTYVESNLKVHVHFINICFVGPDSGDPFPLKVESIDFNIALNGEPHHTSEYEDGGLNQLVVRRGQPFDIDINFSRPYIKEKDDFKLIFQFGKLFLRYRYNVIWFVYVQLIKIAVE